MKNVFAILTLALCMQACGSSDETTDQENQNLSIVGYTTNMLTLRDSVIPMNNTSLHVTCTLDETANHVCVGTYANGEAASANQVNEAMHQLQIDPKIESSLEAGCDDKTLLLLVEPKLTMPQIDTSEFCFWANEDKSFISCDGNEVSEEEAVAINNQYLDQLKTALQTARKSALDTFMAANPDLVSQAMAKAYLDASYGGMNIKLNACDWSAFIDKNKTILDIVELRAIVDNTEPTTCSKAIEYQTLLNTLNYNIDAQPSTTSYQILSSAEDLAPFKAFGLADSVIQTIDFSQNIVIALSAGTKPTTGYSLHIDAICDDAKINAYVQHCAGQPEDDAEAEPILLIQLPSNVYEVTFQSRDIICE